MNKRIVWERYFIDEPLPDLLADDEYVDLEDDKEEKMYSEMMSRLPKLVHTPIGLVNISGNNNPLKKHKLWEMHTNFDITYEVKDILDVIPGVDIFRPTSRYSAVVAVGRLFSSPEVFSSISEALGVETKKISDRILNLKEELTQYKYWGILEIPNGQCESFYTEDVQEYDNMIIAYMEAAELSGGNYYCSKEEYEESN